MSIVMKIDTIDELHCKTHKTADTIKTGVLLKPISR